MTVFVNLFELIGFALMVACVLAIWIPSLLRRGRRPR